MLHKPLIAITLDAEEGGGYSVMPWFALRQNYCEAIVALGGIPLPLPHYDQFAENYAHLVDGVIFTGGAFDIDPALYGEEERHSTVATKHQRTTFEWRLLQLMYDQKKPILGICGGMQLINVAKGGTLIQHIPDIVANCLAHEQPNPRTEPGHDIQIYENTLLDRLINSDKIQVNSAHHQAIKDVASGFRINAMASDGVIEGIEDTTHPFCLGVQWHPEYHVSEADQKIFAGFIEKARL